MIKNEGLMCFFAKMPFINLSQAMKPWQEGVKEM
jgi:hypothetical protein